MEAGLLYSTHSISVCICNTIVLVLVQCPKSAGRGGRNLGGDKWNSELLCRDGEAFGSCGTEQYLLPGRYIYLFSTSAFQALEPVLEKRNG